MSERRRMIGLAGLVSMSVLIAACGGGSGSTGLITSEGTLIDEVRRTGTCAELDGAAYCATDSPNAIAPGGQSVSVVNTVPTPARTATPPSNGGAPTSTPAATSAGPSATPASGPTGSSTPEPGPPTPTPRDGATVSAVVEGFGPGSACATAARSAASSAAWRTGPLVPVDDTANAVSFPLPDAIAPPRDVVLLCFADPPATLAAALTTLADADPTVVFVLPSS